MTPNTLHKMLKGEEIFLKSCLPQAAQQIIELQEAAQINAGLQPANLGRNTSLHDMKTVVKTWRNRLPIVSDDLSHWSSIFMWRQHHYQGTALPMFASILKSVCLCAHAWLPLGVGHWCTNTNSFPTCILVSSGFCQVIVLLYPHLVYLLSEFDTFKRGS